MAYDAGVSGGVDSGGPEGSEGNWSDCTIKPGSPSIRARAPTTTGMMPTARSCRPRATGRTRTTTTLSWARSGTSTWACMSLAFGFMTPGRGCGSRGSHCPGGRGRPGRGTVASQTSPCDEETGQVHETLEGGQETLMTQGHPSKAPFNQVKKRSTAPARPDTRPGRSDRTVTAGPPTIPTGTPCAVTTALTFVPFRRR